MESRILQFKEAAEDASAKPAARLREVKSLTTFLHKHQGDAFSGPSRSALSVAVELHHARSPPLCEATLLLLECTLKMPEKVFAEAHKAKFLKWHDARAAAASAASGGGGDASASAAAQQRLPLLDIDGEGALALALEDGSLYEGPAVVVPDAATRAALSAALQGERQVTVVLSADGAFISYTAA
jgi:hypothetical protein